MALAVTTVLTNLRRHYSTVAAMRERIRIVAGLPDRAEDDHLRLHWIELSRRASVEASNTATEALKGLVLSLEPGALSAVLPTALSSPLLEKSADEGAADAQTDT